MNIGEKHVQLLNARRVARARPSAAMISNSRDFEPQRAFVGALMRKIKKQVGADVYLQTILPCAPSSSSRERVLARVQKSAVQNKPYERTKVI